MDNNRRETEVKIYLADQQSIAKRLEVLGASLVQERIFERNIRYDDSTHSLTARGIVLRLREDTGVTLAYKSAGTVERGIVTREELEVQVSDIATMEAILEKLGYTRSLIYEKYRTTYEWRETRIMLDELPYGCFIEIEGEAEQIEAVLSDLNLQDAQRREQSYTKLFDFVKHHLELDFRDLTFENFAEIEVSENAFIPPGSIVVG